MRNVEKTFFDQLIDGIAKLTPANSFFLCFNVWVNNVAIILDDPFIRSVFDLDLLHLPLSEEIHIGKKRPLAKGSERFRSQNIFIEADNFVHAMPDFPLQDGSI
jgi:hypothetical protein